MASASFLPLTKQSSLSVEKFGAMPQLSKANSYNPFDIAQDYRFDRDMQDAMVEKLDQAPTKVGSSIQTSCSSNYIEETYRKWRGLYMRAI